LAAAGCLLVTGIIQTAVMAVAVSSCASPQVSLGLPV
jgi:hypothetical protein